MLRQKFLKDINQLKKQAVKKQGNVQRLIKSLDQDISIINMDGYSMTLIEATFDTSIQLDQGATIMTPTDNKPWTKLINIKADGDIIGHSEVSHIKKVIPNCQYVVCHVIPDKNNTYGKLNHFKHEYRQPTYKDVVDLINRFYAVKYQLETLDGQGVETDVSSIIQYLEHAKRIAKHGYLKEAVDVALHSNITPEAQDIINHNLYYKDKKNHKMTLETNAKVVKMKNSATKKLHKLTYPDFKLMADNAILHLKKSIAGNTDVTPIKLNSLQKEIIRKLNKIKQLNDVHKQITQIHELIKKYYLDLSYKYDYFDYNNKYLEDKDDIKMDFAHHSKKELKADKDKWNIYSHFNPHSLTGDSLVATPQMVIPILNQYIDMIKNKKLKSIGTKWLNYVKQGHYTVIDDIAFESHSLNKQIRKVTKKDVKDILGNLRFSLTKHQLLINVLNQFKKELINGQFNAVKDEMQKMIKNDTNNRLDDLFSSDVDIINSDCRHMDIPAYNINKTTKSSDLINLINDIEDYGSQQ